eukprot:m.61233 g.61233  ORF g.61233 m.61233 type:complete len:96 (-) comp7329_c0_seq1:27-314(-)
MYEDAIPTPRVVVQAHASTNDKNSDKDDGDSGGPETDALAQSIDDGLIFPMSPARGSSQAQSPSSDDESAPAAASVAPAAALGRPEEYRNNPFFE